MSVMITVLRDGSDWNVWIALDDGTTPPSGPSFIIGSGATRDEAVAEAVKDLEAATDQLQQPTLVGSFEG